VIDVIAGITANKGEHIMTSIPEDTGAATTTATTQPITAAATVFEAVRTAMRWFADPFWGGPKPNLDTVFEVSLRWSGMHDGGG
jgi:hypothetical protein